MTDECDFRERLKTALLVLGWLVSVLIPSAALGEEGVDNLFNNQILSLTQPKEKLAPSGDPRFRDNKDGTVSDLREKLMWKQVDSYQELKEWINWEGAQHYVQEVNEKAFAGHRDWRLPTRAELMALYEEEKSIPWKYYWQNNEVHMDPIFGYTSCCFWSSETKGKFAWGVNFIRGKPYMSMRSGPGLSLSVIRVVRNLNDGGGRAAENHPD